MSQQERPSYIEDPDKALAGFIYDYLLKKNHVSAAAAFIVEAQVNTHEMIVSMSPGECFLKDWFTPFWALYISRNKPGTARDPKVLHYLETTKQLVPEFNYGHLFEDSFYDESSPSTGKNKRLASTGLKGSAVKKSNSSDHSLAATPKQTAPQPFHTPASSTRMEPGAAGQAPPAAGQGMANAMQARPPTNISLPPNSMGIQNWLGNQQMTHPGQGPMAQPNQPQQQQQPQTPQQGAKQPQQGGIQNPQQPMQQQHSMMNQQQMMMQQQLMAQQQQQLGQQQPQGSIAPGQNGTPTSQQLAYALASQSQMNVPANQQGGPMNMRGAQNQVPMLTAQQHQFLAQQSMRQHMFIPQGMPQGMPQAMPQGMPQAMPQGSQMMMQQARPNMMRPNMPYQNPNNMAVRATSNNGAMFPNNAYAEHHKTVQMLKMNTGARPPMMNAQGMMNGDANQSMAGMQMHQQMMNTNQFQSPTTVMGGMSNSPNQQGTPGNHASTPKAPESATANNPPPSGGLSRGSTPANSGSNLGFNNFAPHNGESNTPASSANNPPMTSAPGSQPPANPVNQTPTSNSNNPGSTFHMNQFERYVNDGEFMFNFGMASGTGEMGDDAGNGTGTNTSTSAPGGGGLHPADDLSGSLESIMGMDPFSHSEYF